MKLSSLCLLSSILLLTLEALPAGAQEAEAPLAPAPPSAEASPSQPASNLPGPMDLFIAFSRSQLGAQGFERQQAEIDGRQLVWWQKGPDTAKTLVFLHGVNDQAGTWFQITPALSQYQVLLVDLPGHGESAPQAGAGAGPLPMSKVVSGLEAWLRHVVPEGERVTLVGNSMGAWLAVLVARDLPERIERVVLTNGGPLRADTGGLDLLPADREEARQLMAVLRDPSSPPTPDLVLDDLVRRAPRSQVTRMFEAQDDLESHLMDVEALARVETPVELLWGESDRYLGADYPRQLDAALPASRLTFVPTCGHLPQAECPQRYVELLLEILEESRP